MSRVPVKQYPRPAQNKHQARTHLAVRSIGQRLVVSTMDGTFLIPFYEITHCSANGNYCTITLDSGKEVLLSKTLKFVQAQLPPRLFIRVHQSHLVNKDYVRFVSKDHLILACESKIPIARSRKTIVVRAIVS